MDPWFGKAHQTNARGSGGRGPLRIKLWHDKDYPKIQILTIEGLLSKKERVDAPPQVNPFAKAQVESISGKHLKGKQTELI